MKKVLQICLMMVFAICTTSLRAQQAVFRVKFSVTDAFCYNNGKVLYALTDLDGKVMDSLPNGLSMVRSYFLSGMSDTVHYSGWYYSGGYDTITLNTGTYTIGVEGLLDDGLGGYVKVDTQVVLTVNTTYEKPEAYSIGLSNNDGSSSRAGNRPSLSCINTGRIQLRIEKGRFPYTVTVRDRNTGDTIRTEVFYDRLYNGTSTNLYNYKDFYTIDSLGVGLWDLYLVDGCGYGYPKIEESVSLTSMPTPIRIEVCASSYNFDNDNVVNMEITFDKVATSYQKLMDKYVRYRIVYEGIGTSEWKKLQIYENTSLAIADTVETVSKYCELWDRNITLEYESTCCDTVTKQFTFQIHKPNELYFEKDSANVSDDIATVLENPCVVSVPWHRLYHSIRYHSSGFSSAYDPNKVTRHNDHEYYRYHYTHPLTWVYTDVRNGTVIKRDTVQTINHFSYLYDREVEEIFGGDSDTITVPVQRQLIDARGCLLYSTTDTLSYPHCISQYTNVWDITYSHHNNHCCNKLQEIRLSTAYNPFILFDGTVIRLIESPYGGRYNFEAVYHAQTESWEVHKYNIENEAQIIGSYRGNAIVLRDYCLASGPYTFEIISACDTVVISRKLAFPDIYGHRITVRPTHTVSENCTSISLSYSSGSLLRTRFNTSLETGMPLDTMYDNYKLWMFIADAPSKELIDKYANPFTSYTFSQPGRYVIRIAPSAAVGNFCGGAELYDTLYLGNGLVEFEYVKAMLCDTSSTTGNVYVRGIHGSKPYTYTLYSQPNMQGEILGVNNVGDFLNVPMRSDQELSCLIQDACTAYFPVSFYPNTMTDIQKVWFDGGMTVSTSCEGDTIQVHALTIGNILQYEWSGPGGFTATTSDPYVFIPRGNGDGWYKVDIRNSGCGEVISDSIFLTVQEAPSITLASDTMVCPGEAVEVRFVPVSPLDGGSVTFSIAYSNLENTEIRHYTAENGATVTDFYQTKSPAKIYPVSLDDGRCDYLLSDPDDTIYISLRTDLSAACRLLTTHDTVCYGTDAHVTAKADMTTPYIIRWYGDYEQTKWLKTDIISDSFGHSYYDTLGIMDRTLLFASVEEDGLCPSTNGIATDTLLMHEGTTAMQCGRVYRFYDSGGRKSYSSHEQSTHRFMSSDSSHISITFKDLRLTSTSHLMVFSGSEVNKDSILYDLTGASQNPGTLISRGNALTVYFISAVSTSAGWEAWVESAPGIAVADVWRKNEVTLRDEVCQSQTGTYDDPYGITPEVVSIQELHNAMRHAGSYHYRKVLSNSSLDGCDSVINFEFVVNPPLHHDTTVIAFHPQEEGFRWKDSVYTQSGEHSVIYSLSNGCDSLAVLHLTFLNVDIRDHEICEGDSARLTVAVTTPEFQGLRKQKAKAGDVVCTDGSILDPDSFLISGKTAKGVVFHTDPSGRHGLIVALKETSQTMSGLTFDNLFANLYEELSDAIFDMDGRRNSARLLNIAGSNDIHNFTLKVPAVYYCHYFNHHTGTKDVVPHGWYLPSVGEMNLLISQSFEVNTTLRKLKSLYSQTDLITNKIYWTSTIQQSDRVWSAKYNFDIFNDVSSASNRTRPITTF